MSLLKNRNNEFERKLQEQLDDTEFKPSESLWGRIDREVNRPEFEQRVEGKIGNYAINPYPETWEQIEAQLPPPAKNRRRWGAIWISSITVLFAVAFAGGYFLNKSGVGNESIAFSENKSGSEQVFVKQVEKVESKEIALSTNQPIKKHIASNTIAHKTSKNAVSASGILNQKSELVPLASTTSKRNGVKALVHAKSYYTKAHSATSKFLAKQVVSTNSTKPLAKSNFIAPQLANTTTIVDAEKSAPELIKSDKETPNTFASSTKTVMPLDTPPQSQSLSQPQPTATKITPIADSLVAQSNSKSNDESTPSKITITVLAGVNYGFMTLKDPNGSFAENIALRKQVESSKLDWSGGFLLDYQLGKKWLLSSGIQITNFSMDMSFGTAKSLQQPYIGQGGNLVISDSVTQSGTNNLRIKYSWNEIPLLITYKSNANKRFGFETKFGLSYAIVNVVDAAMIAQNNVGVYSLKSKEAFPGFNNIVFAQAYIGVNFKLNESVTLLAMPYAKYSLNNMIARENWVKQYPFILGVSLGLRKSF